MSDFRTGVRQRAAARPRRIALPEAEEPRTLAAVATVLEEDLANPVLVGRTGPVRALLAEHGLPEDLEVVDPESPAPHRVARLVDRRGHRGMTEEKAAAAVRDPVLHAALMVGLGEVDGSVAGAIHSTGDVLRAAFHAVGPAAGVRTVSSSFYMTVSDFRGRGREVLSFTDAGVVQYPDADQLVDIAAAACDARRRVVGDDPVVAFLSHSTRGSADGPSVDRMREALERFRELHPDVSADGEFQADAALIEAVGRRKAPDSEIAGRANVLVFPDLDSANIAYKLTERLAGAEAVGPIVQGLARPCNDLSRGSRPDDIVDVICVTALMSVSGT